jgi:hypothetical protein
MNEFDDRELSDALRRRAGAATDGFGIEAAHSAVIARAGRVRRRRAAVAGGAAMAGLIAAAVFVIGPGSDSVVTTPADQTDGPPSTSVDTTAPPPTEPGRTDPDRQVIVLNGDGCMLMNLGCLVTITAARAPNFVLIVCDNSVYEVTGQQLTAAAGPARPGAPAVDYCAIARAAGFREAYRFDRLDAWESAIRDVLAARGPTFVLLEVEPVPGGAVPKSPAPAAKRAIDFAKALQATVGP